MSRTLFASAVASAVLCSAAWVRARMTVVAAQPPDPGLFSSRERLRPVIPRIPPASRGGREAAIPTPTRSYGRRYERHGHRLIQGVEHALGWTGSSALGTQFARGKLSDAELVTRLLTPRRLLDVLMWHSLSPPQVRCLINGTELHPRDYIAESMSRRGQAIPMVDMHRLGHLLESGCTLVVDAINRWDATMEVTCRSWQWWSRERVQVNTYLTTQGTSGFTLHWDDHDVVIVQLAGEKSWDVRTPSRPVPMYRDAAPNSEPSNECVWSGSLTAPEQGRDQWAAACTALDDITAGWCRSWGVACWDPRPVLTVLDRALPAPALAMVRAGLLVRPEILDAGERLATWFGLARHALWGMSPYGGQATHPVWDEVDTRQFLHENQDCSRVSAAFRVAYELPQVSRVAVSTSSAEHLAELVEAATLDADDNRIARYRSLLHPRRRRTPQPHRTTPNSSRSTEPGPVPTRSPPPTLAFEAP